MLSYDASRPCFVYCNECTSAVSASQASLNFRSIAAQSTSGVQILTFTSTAAGTFGSYQVLVRGNRPTCLPR